MWHSDYPGHLLLRLTEQTPSLVFHSSQQFDKHAHKLISVYKWLQNIPGTTSEVSVQKSATLGTVEILRYSQTPRPLVEDSSLGCILYIYYTYFLHLHTHILYICCFRLLLGHERPGALLQVLPLVPTYCAPSGRHNIIFVLVRAAVNHLHTVSPASLYASTCMCLLPEWFSALFRLPSQDKLYQAAWIYVIWSWSRSRWTYMMHLTA